jgi:hypothetical protein
VIDPETRHALAKLIGRREEMAIGGVEKINRSVKAIPHDQREDAQE